MNNNIYYKNNSLQTVSNNIIRNSIDLPKNSIFNTNYNYNNYSSLATTSPLIFNIPKQTNFLNYQPSTPTRKKNIINLNDNLKLKNSSNISVVYKKLFDFDSLNNYNKNDHRHASPLPNKYIYKDNNNYQISYPKNAYSSINQDEKIFRIAKTPEPKQINYNEYHSKNHYNINIYVNNPNNQFNSLEAQKPNFQSPKRIKPIQNAYNIKNIHDNIKLQNNIQLKKLNSVNYTSLSNDNNMNKINYLPKETNIYQQLENRSIYNSPIRKKYITLSNDSNSNFYNSPQVEVAKKNIYLKDNYINYNSPQRKNKLIHNSLVNNSYNILYSPIRNDMNLTSYKNNNFNITNNYYQKNQALSNRYNSPEKNNSPMDNMRHKHQKPMNQYNRIKSDNFIKRIAPPKMIQNRVNLIPIPKKIINENSSDNNVLSNFLSTSMNLNDMKYNSQLNMNVNNNIKNIQHNQNNQYYHYNLNYQNNISNYTNGNISSILPPGNSFIQKEEPKNDFIPNEFKIIKKLGEGTFGKIYCIKWLKTNELFAMKKMDLDEYDVYVFKKKVRLIQNFIKDTGHNGLIKLYGDKSIQQQKINGFYYYVIMELAERDLEKEINNRKAYNRFYSEEELLDFILQLVKTLSLMQKNSITHRDIKPQNILLLKGFYKLCDFGETKIISGDGPILQSVRGSELYMSPILFYAYNRNVQHVLHNTYKSDVFSLGMCTLLVSCLSARPLCDIREIKNMVTVETIVINSLINKYSKKMINLILKMLEIDENLRMDFIQLEEYISNIWPNKEYYFKS